MESPGEPSELEVFFADIAAKACEQAYKGSVAIVLCYRRHVEQLKTLLAVALREQSDGRAPHHILVDTSEGVQGITIDHACVVRIHERDEAEEILTSHTTDPGARCTACIHVDVD